MVMSIARQIKAGRNGPKKAGNQRKTNCPKNNNKWPSNSTVNTRLGSAVTSGPEVITGLGGTAVVGAVAVAVNSV